MTVRTSYFGGLSSYDHVDADAVFGVVRYPRNFVERLTDRDIPAVAPLEDLLNAYKTVEEAADENGEADPRRSPGTPSATNPGISRTSSESDHKPCSTSGDRAREQRQEIAKTLSTRPPASTSRP